MNNEKKIAKLQAAVDGEIDFEYIAKKYLEAGWEWAREGAYSVPTETQLRNQTMKFIRECVERNYKMCGSGGITVIMKKKKCVVSFGFDCQEIKC